MALPQAATAAMTHTVSVTGEFVNSWKVADASECAQAGEGKVTVVVRSAALRVYPYFDRFQSGGGKWIVAVSLGGRRITDAPYIRAAGTITRTDNTTQNPPIPDTGPCDPLEKPGCGTFPLRRAVGYVGRFDRRRIIARVGGSPEFNAVEPCLAGDVSGWNSTSLVGGNRNFDVMVTMPTAATLRNRPVVVLTGSTRKVSTDRSGDKTTTNDVTRKVKVTFRRL
ncbi:MAG TPA: hypothetical protein VNB64_12955 [Solirubrobacteraceae bacterium]|nr:hypothetical protein [Solirubrobacteraceae bacterium]